MDLEAFRTYWALEVLLTHADGFTNKGNNYFVYFDPGPDKMYAIPWGVDKTFIPSSYQLLPIYNSFPQPTLQPIARKANVLSRHAHPS